VKRLTDPTFRYVPAAATDIRKTFQRIRRQQQANAKEAAAKTVQLPARKHG